MVIRPPGWSNTYDKNKIIQSTIFAISRRNDVDTLNIFFDHNHDFLGYNSRKIYHHTENIEYSNMQANPQELVKLIPNPSKWMSEDAKFKEFLRYALNHLD